MSASIKISTDKSLLNVDLIHQFLSTRSGWAKGIDLKTVQTAIDYSLCFGAYENSEQIGFARVITDYATFGNLVDVFVLPEYQGQGVAKKIMQEIVNHTSLMNLRRFTLATSDAHGLYTQFGFVALHKPHTFMEIYRPDIYTSVP